MRIAPLIFLIILLTGCSDFDKKKQLEKIDELNAELELVEADKSDSLIEDLEEIKERVDEMTSAINDGPDTLTLDQAKLIDQFKIVKNSIAPYDQLMGYIDTNIVLSRTGLDNLKKDIEGAQGKRQDYDSYLEHESAKVDSIKTRLEELIKIKSSILESYEICYPAIISELEPIDDSGIDIVE
jgi:chromosome segregation ATPase